jgi:hypothetical protein
MTDARHSKQREGSPEHGTLPIPEIPHVVWDDGHLTGIDNPKKSDITLANTDRQYQGLIFSPYKLGIENVI